MAQTETDDAEPVTAVKAPPLNKEIKELDMTKLIKLFTLAVLWLASLLPAAAEIDLFEIKAALVLGKTDSFVFKDTILPSHCSPRSGGSS